MHQGTPEFVISKDADYAVSRKSVLWVDANNGSGYSGKTPGKAVRTIQRAIDLSREGGIVKVIPRRITALAIDPVSYAETLVIPNDKPGLQLVGVPSTRVQGGLPQIRIGAGSTPMIDVKAPGCHFENLGINGASSTGGGIYLRDNGTDPATTAVSFGATIENCHFKNCKCHATHGSAGGAIYTDGAWQVRVSGCNFYKNVGGIVVLAVSDAQDWVIENNVFNSSINTDVDVDILVTCRIKGISVTNNTFATVDVPTMSSGDVGRYIKIATGSYGIINKNSFACTVGEADSQKTFGVAGTAVDVPTTVIVTADNTGETSDTAAGSQDSGLVYRTD